MTANDSGGSSNVPDVRTVRTDILLGGLILAFTALPTRVEVADPQALRDILAPSSGLWDLIANILGYVPLGMALSDRRPSRALILAALLSTSAEAAQLFGVDRTPSVLDIVSNVLGASLGLAVASRWRAIPRTIGVTRASAAVAATLALAYLVSGAGATAEGTVRWVDTLFTAPVWVTRNARGHVSPGALEGHWPLDSIDDGVVKDVSGNRLDGRAVHSPTPSSGVVDGAVTLDGSQWIDLGDPVPLRLTGSMTLSAWVRPSAFPEDDAAIISSHNGDGLGYQLDLTVDEGPRTIGFKLSDLSGRLMARYGRTPMVAGRWYHVAGVYDAESRAMDVYLDGRKDNGCLLGRVRDRQKVSGAHVFLGRRAALAGFEFRGAIDDARIHSRPLAASEILAEVETSGRPVLTVPGSPDAEAQGPEGAGDGPCPPRILSRRGRYAGPLVLFGMLVAFACVGFWRGPRFRIAALAGGCVAGLAASSSIATGLAAVPAPETLLYPLGGAVVVVAAGLGRMVSGSGR